MGRKIIITVFIPAIIFCLYVTAQNTERQQEIIDSLTAIIHQQKGDTAEVNALFTISFRQATFDSQAKYARQGLALAQRINFKRGEADCYYALGDAYADAENYSQAIQNHFAALKIYTDIADFKGMATVHMNLYGSYFYTGDLVSCLSHLYAGLKIVETNNVRGLKNSPEEQLIQFYWAELGYIYLEMNRLDPEKGQLDSALLYTQKAINHNIKNKKPVSLYQIYLLGCIQRQKRNYELALSIYRSGIKMAKHDYEFHDTLRIYCGMSTLFKMQGKLDSSIYFAQQVVQSLNPVKPLETYVEAVNNLALDYRLTGNKDSALRYIELSHALKDSMYNIKKVREIQNIAFNEQLKQQEIISAEAKYKSRVQLYAVVGGLLVMLFIAGLLWNNNRQRKKAYALLQNQKEETEIQKSRVEEALEELKITQAQLIQSEKMASLGELTTGIAHEIQNPLNFVNNFSEVNLELTTELKDELEKTEMEVKDKMSLGHLINDLIQNEEKINHHGKRADAIVKSMLQHSRGSTGQKEPTDINVLADEYLTLAYHGMRARDKNLPAGHESFQAILQTNFDPGIDKISIIPQDIGKVLLNLYNNAFYTVMEKKKMSGDAYEPQVTVTTRLMSKSSDRQGVQMQESAERNSHLPSEALAKAGSVIVSIKDNGMGIPKKIIDKIFQPFFTTKPTGQGTGLGLSLSYDIIKAHHGELNVETKEGEWTEFIIRLPALN